MVDEKLNDIDEDEDEVIEIADIEEPVDEENNELAPTEEDNLVSSLVIDNTVVEKIVAITCRSVDGVLQMKGNLISSIQEGFGGTDITKGVQVEMVGEDACIVNLSIIMEYGKSATKIFNELHDKISEKITDMTGLRVDCVNVRITNVMTREEAMGTRRRERPERSDRLRDRARTNDPDAHSNDPDIPTNDPDAENMTA